MLNVRRCKDRGHVNYGWLDSYHSFSFADYCGGRDSLSRPTCVAGTRYNLCESVSLSQARAAMGMNEPGTSGHSWIHAPPPGIRRHRMAP
ncbi:MAG: hypothetical protein WD823_04240 [Sulfuricaulis sp.]